MWLTSGVPTHTHTDTNSHTQFADDRSDDEEQARQTRQPRRGGARVVSERDVRADSGKEQVRLAGIAARVVRCTRHPHTAQPPYTNNSLSLDTPTRAHNTNAYIHTHTHTSSVNYPLRCAANPNCSTACIHALSHFLQAHRGGACDACHKRGQASPKTHHVIMRAGSSDHRIAFMLEARIE